jgi:hypothetical protein
LICFVQIPDDDRLAGSQGDNLRPFFRTIEIAVQTARNSAMLAAS